MRLESAIALLEVMAGGQGSGCKGPNCGRPASRYVTQQFTTPTGIRVTMVKPRGESVRQPRNPLKQKHVLKGRFTRLEKHFGSGLVRPGHNLRTWMSEAQAQWSKKYGLRGATVFVHRYTDRKTGKPTETVVDEHNWIGQRNRYDKPVRHAFKNSGKAAGYVKRRYGLSIPLKEYRG